MKLLKSPISEFNDIKHLCESCNENSFITIDTEFVRNKSFFPKLCLIQIANKKQAVIIDTIVSKNLKPIEKLLTNSKIVKVLHSSRQDLEVFYNTFKILPKNIFDTQIAYSFLGLDDQISYEKLVLKYCNKKIDKKYQYCDWSLRPLNLNQINYALSDVSYLIKIFTKMNNQLKKKIEWNGLLKKVKSF